MSDESLPIERGEPAAITGLFGALTRRELQQAVISLCERRGVGPAESVVCAVIDEALATCRLIVAPMATGSPLEDAPIVVGPNASPSVPPETPWLFEQFDIKPRALDVDAIDRAVDTELERAIERAREGKADASGDELESIRSTLSDWQPVTIDLEDAIAETVPIEPDELAGIVEPFGALTRPELRQAASVLCYRRGVDASDAAFEGIVDRALTSRRLLVAPLVIEEPLEDVPIVVGPIASPVLPEEFDDLAGLLGIEPRPIDPEAVIRAALDDRDRLPEAPEETIGEPPEPDVLDESIADWDPSSLASPTIGEQQNVSEEAESTDMSWSGAETTADATDGESPNCDSPPPGSSSTAPDRGVDSQQLLARPPDDQPPDVPIEPDELAGIVELFGALTRNELRRAASELCYRRGVDVDDEPLDASIDRALSEFVLLAAPGVTDEPLEAVPIVAGPAAFPAHPEHAEDLPHILDVEPRAVDRATARDVAVNQFQGAIEIALESKSGANLDGLLELCFDLETWGAVSLDVERDRLQRQLED